MGLVRLIVIATFAMNGASANKPLPTAPLTFEYPKHCLKKAARIETVTVAYDVVPTGVTENIRILDASNNCFVEAASDAVGKWMFHLTAQPGGSINRKDFRVTISFDRLNAPSSPDRKIRGSVRRRLASIERHLTKGKDPNEALKRLGKIEGKYGESFSLAEAAAFNLICAAARYDAGDAAGALEDLRSAKTTGVLDQNDPVIIDLEKKLRAQWMRKPE